MFRDIAEERRRTAKVTLYRGHSGQMPPFSVPFTYSITIDDQVAWWAWINFDQLYVENPYSGPQLLARFCSNLRSLAEGELVYGDDHFDEATWTAVLRECLGEQYDLPPPEDMRSIRNQFTRRTFAELADADPAQFLVYEIQTVSAANGCRSTMRSEFRIVSRPAAPHRWIFWTNAPKRISHDSSELYFWFTRHVAQLRGPRRPKWNEEQRHRWMDHVHRQLTGRTEAELRLEALAAPPEKKPDVSLTLGSEEAAGGVRRWVIPRQAFSDVKWIGADIQLGFVDLDDSRSKTVTLRFHSVAIARTTIEEILRGERRRIGIGKHLRGIIAAVDGENTLTLIGLTTDEEKEHVAGFVAQHGSISHSFRSGLLFQMFGPER